MAEVIAKPASQPLQYPSGTKGTLFSLASLRLLSHGPTLRLAQSQHHEGGEEGAEVVCGHTHA